jgi:hypothetical protein
VRVVVNASGALQLRSDVAGTTRSSGVQLGTGTWVRVEACGSIGSASSWDLYRDGVRILTGWTVSTGSNPVASIQLGDNTAKSFTANFDDVAVDTAAG